MSWLGAFIVGISLAAPAPGVDCGAFERSIDDSLKSSAMAEAGTIGDDSAPRQTNTELKVANELRLIGLNLELMKAAGCPLPKSPLSGSKYLLPALECRTAIMRRTLNHGGSEVPTECDQAKWQPTGTGKQVPRLKATAPTATEQSPAPMAPAETEQSPTPPAEDTTDQASPPEAAAASEQTPPPEVVAVSEQVPLPPAASPPEPALISLAKFQKVSKGMTLDQVIALLGAEATDRTVWREGKSSTDVYTWSNGANPANMTVGFQGGKVVWKKQVWLE